MYRQYLYVVYDTGMDKDVWEGRYQRNMNDFARYVADRSVAEYVEFISFHVDEGIVKQSVVKE